MEVYVIIARKKTQIFLDLKENTPVIELKRMIGGILKVTPDNMRLFHKNLANELLNDKSIKDYNLKIGTTTPHDPALLGLMLRSPSGGWETLEIAAMSKPVPSLPRD